MANIKPCSNYTIPRLQKSCWVSQTGSGGFWRSHAPVERPARRCHRWSTLRSFDLCARRSTRCLTNIQQQCTTSHIRVVGTQITNKYKIWTTGMGSENIHWGPLGTISHTSWKVSKLWQDRAGVFNPCRMWCVADATYVACLQKNIHSIKIFEHIIQQKTKWHT